MAWFIPSSVWFLRSMTSKPKAAQRPGDVFGVVGRVRQFRQVRLLVIAVADHQGYALSPGVGVGGHQGAGQRKDERPQQVRR
jgi:hypothetical protein